MTSLAPVLKSSYFFRSQEFPQAEAFLLRAQRVDITVKYYREAGMWSDALRVSREYLPAKFDEIQREYEREVAKKGPR